MVSSVSEQSDFMKVARSWQGSDKAYLYEASSETRNLQMEYPVIW